jgi:hypothetical protein
MISKLDHARSRGTSMVTGPVLSASTILDRTPVTASIPGLGARPTQKGRAVVRIGTPGAPSLSVRSLPPLANGVTRRSVGVPGRWLRHLHAARRTGE